MTTSSSASLLIRPPTRDDYAAWKPLWDGYNAFYKREGPTALPDEITQVTWQRFFDPYEPVHALVAERDGQLVGLTHYLFHRSTTRIEPNCYLQDLFTLPSERGRGVGRQLGLNQGHGLPVQEHGSQIENDIHAVTGTTETPWLARDRVVCAPAARGRARSLDTTNTGPSAVSKAYS